MDSPENRSPTLGHTTTGRTMLTAPALIAGVVCLAAVAVTTVAARHAAPAGSPLVPPGSWRPMLWVGVIGAFAAYTLAVLLLSRASGRPGPAIVLTVLIQSAPLAAPLLLSSDARAYTDYGRAADPYAGGNASVYGPLWTLLSRAAVQIGDATFVFRLIAAGSVIAIAVAAGRLVAHRKALAIAFVGWNPLVALHFAGAGHNDALMMAAVFGALLLASHGLTQLSGAAWATSFFVKWSSAPLYLLWAIDRRRQGKGAGVGGAVTASLAIVVVAYAAFGWTWLHAFTHLSAVEHQKASFGMLAWLDALGTSNRWSLQLSHLCELAAFLVFAWRAHRYRLQLGLAAGVIAVLAPRLEPWYVLWGIALSAADDEDRWGKVVAVVLTGLVLSDALTSALNA